MAHLPKDSFADADFNSKKSYMYVRRERRRITWTRFHLSREQDWRRWTAAGDSKSDGATFLGPLAGVEGCEKVWLGRQVEDPEKAALIVWIPEICSAAAMALGSSDIPSASGNCPVLLYTIHTAPFIWESRNATVHPGITE
jgi:hypothetical protein